MDKEKEVKNIISSLVSVFKKALNTAVERPLFALSVVVNVGVVMFIASKFLGGGSGKQGPRYRSPTVVKVEKAVEGQVPRSETYAGKVHAKSVVPILSEASGRIKEVLFNDGDVVRKGDVLVVMDDGQAKATLSATTAQLKLRRAERAKQQALVKGGSLSKAALEIADAQYEEAMARVENAQLALDAMRIKAPFDGKMGLIRVHAGAHVQPNQEIARIVSMGGAYVEFEVPEREVRHIKLGQEATALSKGFDLLPIALKITAISPYSDPVSHTVQIRASLADSKNVQDGAYAEVRINLASDGTGVVVPQEAFESLDSDYLYVLFNGRAVKKHVVRGHERDGLVQVVHGVSVGDLVIVDPVSYLTDGLPVRLEGK
jgi:membrane fusion protein (multidrug efflux system)